MAEEKEGSKKQLQKTTIILVAITIAVFAVLVVLIIRKRPPAPSVPVLPEPLVVEIVSRATSSAESTRQWVFQQGRASYSLVGRFEAPLQSVGERLRGTFFIDSDPNETEIAVIIKSHREDGLYSLGKYTEEFGEGHMQASLEPMDVIQENVKPGEPVELRFMYHPTVTPTAVEERTRELLERLLVDDWTIPSGFSLTPVAVGIIE